MFQIFFNIKKDKKIPTKKKWKDKIKYKVLSFHSQQREYSHNSLDEYSNSTAKYNHLSILLSPPLSLSSDPDVAVVRRTSRRKIPRTLRASRCSAGAWSSRRASASWSRRPCRNGGTSFCRTRTWRSSWSWSTPKTETSIPINDLDCPTTTAIVLMARAVRFPRR